MALAIIVTILMIPVIGYSLWAYFNPEDSMLLFKRWKYEDVEFSELAIDLHKFGVVIGMILISFIIFNLYYCSPLLNVIFIACYCIFVGLKLSRILSK